VSSFVLLYKNCYKEKKIWLCKLLSLLCNTLGTAKLAADGVRRGSLWITEWQGARKKQTHVQHSIFTSSFLRHLFFSLCIWGPIGPDLGDTGIRL